MGRGAGIRLGGAYYEIVLNDEAMRAQFNAAQTDAQRLAVAMQAALNVRPQAGGLSTIQQQLQALAQANPGQSLNQLMRTFQGMGGSTQGAVQALQQLGAVQQQVAYQSNQTVRAIDAQARSIRDMMREARQVGQQVNVPGYIREVGSRGGSRFRSMQSGQYASNTEVRTMQEIELERRTREAAQEARERRSNPAAIQRRAEMVENLPTNVVQTQQGQLDWTTHTQAALQRLAEAEGEHNAQLQITQRRYDEIRDAAARSIETQDRAARISQASEPQAIADRMAARRVDATGPQYVRVAGEQREVTAQNREALRAEARQHQEQLRRQQRLQQQIAPEEGGGGGGGRQGFLGSIASQFERPTNIFRGGAALLGIPLGISIVAGSMRLIHEAIQSILDGQLQWEQSTHNLVTLYGGLGQQMANTANLMVTHLPGLGTQTEAAQQMARLAPLTQRYGLATGVNAQGTVQTAMSSVGITQLGRELSLALGARTEQERATINQQLQQAITPGGGTVAGTSIMTDPRTVALRMGMGGAQAMQVVTPDIQSKLQLATATQQAETNIGQSSADRRGMVDLVNSAQHAMDVGRANLEQGLETGSIWEKLASQQAVAAFGQSGQVAPAEMRYTALGAQGVSPDELKALQTQLETDKANLAAFDRRTQEAQATLDAFNRTGMAASARLASWAGDVENSTSIQYFDQVVRATADAVQRSLGGAPPIGQTQAQIERAGRQTGLQQAYEQFYVAPQAGQALDKNDPINRFLQGIAGGQNVTAEMVQAFKDAGLTDLASSLKVGAAPTAQQQQFAAQALQAAPRLGAYNTIEGTLGQANQFAGTQQQQAQNALTRIQNQEAQNLASYQREITDATRARLQAEAAIIPLQLQQAQLAHDIAVASRDNLTVRANLIGAQQEALPAHQKEAMLQLQINNAVDHQREVTLQIATTRAQMAAAPLEFAQQQNQMQMKLLGQQYAASVVNQMQGGEATVDYGASIRQMVGMAYQGIEQAPGVTQAQMGVQQAQYNQQQGQYATAMAQAPFQMQLAAVQDSSKQLEVNLLAAQQAQEADNMAIQASLIPLEAAKRALEDKLFSATQARDVASATVDQINNEVAQQNLADAAAKTYWQDQLRGAQNLTTETSDASIAAFLWAYNIKDGIEAMRKAQGLLTGVMGAEENAGITTQATGAPRTLQTPTTDTGLASHLGTSMAVQADAGIHFNGPVNINNADDIDRIARSAADEAAKRAYDSVTAALTHALNTAQPGLPASLPGAQRSGLQIS